MLKTEALRCKTFQGFFCALFLQAMAKGIGRWRRFILRPYYYSVGNTNLIVRGVFP